jgi:hypothetical protein
MRKIEQILLFLVVGALALPAFADTLVLKSGEKVTGYYQGGTARVIKFQTADGSVKDYDILSVQQIQFGESTTAAVPAGASSAPVSAAAPAAPAIPPASSAPSADPRLLPGNQRVTRPTSSTAAATGYTIPTGGKVVIRMIDGISSEKNKPGDVFVAVLEEPITQDNIEIVPKGADVRGRIASVESAGRVTGSAQLGLELTQIYVNNIPYSLMTSEYEEVGESRTGQTAKRAAGGAAIGALIGAIAGGGKGAAIGAGAGAAAGAGSGVFMKGQRVKIPSETLLTFTTQEPTKL